MSRKLRVVSILALALLAAASGLLFRPSDRPERERTERLSASRPPDAPLRLQSGDSSSTPSDKRLGRPSSAATPLGQTNEHEFRIHLPEESNRGTMRALEGSRDQILLTRRDVLQQRNGIYGN